MKNYKFVLIYLNNKIMARMLFKMKVKVTNFQVLFIILYFIENIDK